MADPEIQIDVEGGTADDVEMAENELAETGVDDSGLQDIETDTQPRKTFLE